MPLPRLGNFSRLTIGGSVVLAVLLGGAVGIGGFTFSYANGAAYLQDDPAVCANCHVMNEQYDNWARSSHHTVAVCNDCHTPKGFLNKYWTKTLNGWNHGSKFTTGDFHEPIQITPRNAEITEERCRACHGPVVEAIDAHASRPGSHQEQLSCVRCHRNVGHAH